MENKLLSPTSDFIFKLIFGDKRNVDILAAFLRTILDLPENEYEHLTIIDPHLKPESVGDKLGILDVKVHTKSGQVINVEIQVSGFPEMRERIVFYSAKMITEQIGKADSYDVIKKVVSIVITDYILIEENEKYHNRYNLYDSSTGSKFTDILEINVLELPKLPSENDNTELWEWMLFLKTNREEELSMLAEKNPQIKQAIGVLMELSQDERTRLLYEAQKKAQRDEMARMSEARQEGIKEGSREKAIAIANALLKKKMSIDDVVGITGLSHEEIEKLPDQPEKSKGTVLCYECQMICTGTPVNLGQLPGGYSLNHFLRGSYQAENRPLARMTCAVLVQAKHSIPYHMAPDKLFNRNHAKRFEVENRLIMADGEEITIK